MNEKNRKGQFLLVLRAKLKNLKHAQMENEKDKTKPYKEKILLTFRSFGTSSE